MSSSTRGWTVSPIWQLGRREYKFIDKQGQTLEKDTVSPAKLIRKDSEQGVLGFGSSFNSAINHQGDFGQRNSLLRSYQENKDIGATDLSGTSLISHSIIPKVFSFI